MMAGNNRYNKYRLFAILGISLSITSFISFAIAGITFSFALIPIAMIGFIGGAIVGGIFSKKYKDAIKDIYVLEKYKQHFQNVTYQPSGGMNREEIRSIDLFQVGSTYTTNDLIKGTYHNLSFSQFDASSSTTTGSGDDKSTTYHFVGQVYTFDFIKNTEHYHKLVTAKDYGRFTRSIFKDVKPMTLEDERFNKYFKSFSNYEHEAFYIFTPQFMSKLMSLRDSLKGGLSVVIKDSKLYLSVYSNKDSHEPSLLRKVDVRYTDDIESSIQLIKDIADELGLLSTYFKSGEL